jgi:predicted metal-dependent hydrolase
MENSKRTPALEQISSHFVAMDAGMIRVEYVRNMRARRYILRLKPDGALRVTLPRGGSIREGWGFARDHLGWIRKQLEQRTNRPSAAQPWAEGTEILFRGEWMALNRLDPGEKRAIAFGGEIIPVTEYALDWRKDVERGLWKIGWRDLPPRTRALASEHQLKLQSVAVRNQRTRWGSCSARGTVSLNWRLVQTPDWVRDYIILHELMHLRVMNHSRRFWSCVAQACPDYLKPEEWLRKNSEGLRSGRNGNAPSRTILGGGWMAANSVGK